jgi:hypothetical protein
MPTQDVSLARTADLGGMHLCLSYIPDVDDVDLDR